MRKAMLVGTALFLLAASLTLSTSSTSREVSEAAPVTYEGVGDPSGMTVDKLNDSTFIKPPGARFATEGLPPPQTGGGGGGFHAWALAREWSHNGSYVGSHSMKNSGILLTQPSSGCTGPIYLPIWLNIAFVDGQQGWIEQGISFECNGSKHVYGFAAKNFNPAVPTGTLEGGIWTNYNQISGIAGWDNASIPMEQYRDGDTGAGCAWWGQKYHGYLLATVNFGVCGIGTRYESGMESYNNWAIAQGAASLSTHNFGLVWNGVPGSGRYYSTAAWDQQYADYQMHVRAYGWPWSDWVCVKQNAQILASGGNC